MAAKNPIPTRITTPLWEFWTDFDAHEPTVLLGGIFANKRGYHNYRDALPSTDYSSGRDVASDKRGPGSKASAIDLTMPTAGMKLYTIRLDTAARARDPRLYTARGPILREFIGTKDGKTVYCYVLVGGKPLGVKTDAGSDPGRDKSHLWHIHLSIIREFVDNAVALAGLLSVMVGETLEQYLARGGELVEGTSPTPPAPPASALPTFRLGSRTLKRGSRGTDVREMQSLLVKRGWKIAADGIFGTKTDTAVRAFQKARWLAVDGIVGAQTIAALRTNLGARALRRGMSGEDAKELQRLLNARAKAGLAADGIFGAKTDTAVRSFQKARRLTVDGIAGQQTVRALRG